jgi:hypothetical protein
MSPEDPNLCVVRWDAPLSMQLYTLLMRAMYTRVPMWAVCRVDVIRNDIRRLLPDLLLEQRLNSLPVKIWSENPSEVVVMKYRQEVCSETGEDESTDFIVDTRHIQMEKTMANAHVSIHPVELYRMSIRDFRFMHPLRAHKTGLAVSRLASEPPPASLEFKITIDSKAASDDQTPSRRYPISNCAIVDSDERGVLAISYRLRGAFEGAVRRSGGRGAYATRPGSYVGIFKNPRDVITTAYMSILASVDEFDTLARIALDPPLPPMRASSG